MLKNSQSWLCKWETNKVSQTEHTLFIQPINTLLQEHGKEGCHFVAVEVKCQRLRPRYQSGFFFPNVTRSLQYKWWSQKLSLKRRLARLVEFGKKRFILLVEHQHINMSKSQDLTDLPSSVLSFLGVCFLYFFLNKN